MPFERIPQRRPLHGRRLLSAVIDERAQRGHHRPYASVPNSDNVKDGYRDVSYRQFANCINRGAHWLTEHVSRSVDLETVVYIGAFDLRYQILAMAAVKSGHVVRAPLHPLSASVTNHADVLRLTTKQPRCSALPDGARNGP